MVIFHLGKSLIVELNCDAVLVKGRVAMCMSDVNGEMVKAKGRRGADEVAGSLEYLRTVKGQPYREGFPKNPRLSSVNNRLIGGL